MQPSTAPAWYAPYYCEENVWRLLRDNPDGATSTHAVFISNVQRACPVWNQRASPSPEEPVLWDYHVVMLGRDTSSLWAVWDLDSTLGCPVPALAYLLGTFPMARRLQPQWLPQFRVVDHATLRAHFTSDRSHMRTSDGGWTHPPPVEPPIEAHGHAHNLFSFVDMTQPFVGTLMDLEELRAWIARG